MRSVSECMKQYKMSVHFVGTKDEEYAEDEEEFEASERAVGKSLMTDGLERRERSLGMPKIRVVCLGAILLI
jgi:hypothetical protein